MILIVEDDPIARRALVSLFAAKGLATKAVPTAEDALIALDAPEIPQTVLIDIDLPGMNGLELLERIRGEHPEVSCSLMSANDYAATRDPRQAVPFFPKPLDWKHLLSVLRGPTDALS
jgi:two-component system response regulator FlrC